MSGTGLRSTSASALSDLTDLAVDVLDEMNAPAFPGRLVLERLAPAVDAESAVFQWTDWRSGDTEITVHGFPAGDVGILVEASRTRRFEHPLMVATSRGELAPATLQRVTGGARVWQNHPLRSWLKEVGGWDQLASIGLHGDDRAICGVCFARPGPDFTAGELDLLAGVQPLLQAVQRHVRSMDRWQASLRAVGDGAVGEGPAGDGPVGDGAAARAADSGLTPREVSVLCHIAAGLTAAAAAHRMGCSPRTVEKHAGNLYRKLGVTDRVGAVLEGQRRSLLAPPRTRQPGDG